MRYPDVYTQGPYPDHPFDLAIQGTTHRNYAYVSVIAENLEDRHQITVKARTEADLVKLLFTDFQLLPCPKKEDIFRTAAECDRIRKEMATKPA